MGVSELTDKLGLHSLRSRTVRAGGWGPGGLCVCAAAVCDPVLSLQWHVQATCATQGTGLYEGLDWLSNELAK